MHANFEEKFGALVDATIKLVVYMGKLKESLEEILVLLKEVRNREERVVQIQDEVKEAKNIRKMEGILGHPKYTRAKEKLGVQSAKNIRKIVLGAEELIKACDKYFNLIPKNRSSGLTSASKPALL